MAFVGRNKNNEKGYRLDEKVTNLPATVNNRIHQYEFPACEL